MSQIAAELSRLTSGIRIQSRVICALMLREIKTRYGRQRLGYLWAIIEPIMFVVVLAAIFSMRGRGDPLAMPLIPFLVTGIIPYFLFRDLLGVGLQAVKSNQALLTYPQITLFDILLARALLETATHLLVFLILIIAITSLVHPLRIEEPLLILAWFTIIALLGFGSGLGLGALAAIFRTVEQLVPALISRPMFFISGVFFTVDMLPKSIHHIVLLNPLLHLIELLRSAFFVNYESIYASQMYAIYYVIAVLCLGLLTLSALRKQILCAPRN